MYEFIYHLRKQQVRRFFDLVWNKQITETLPDFVTDTFTFRTAFGEFATGCKAYSSHVNALHSVFRGYQTTLEEMVSENNRVFAKTLHCGIHQREFWGAKASEKSVNWEGSCILTFEGQRIRDMVCMSDVCGLRQFTCRPVYN